MNVLKITLALAFVIMISFTCCDNSSEMPQQEHIEPCHCILDTLIGQWSWFRTYGGFSGNTTDNEFKLIIKMLNQNEDASINYEVFVSDTLYDKGNFQIQKDQWDRRSVNIKLPHELRKDDSIWFIYFFNVLEMEFNDTSGQFEYKPSKDNLTFWDGNMDGYNYIYKKIN